MVVGERSTDGIVDFKATLWSEEFDPRRLKWVVPREQESSPVVTSLVGALLEAKDEEVPRVDVLLFRLGHKICQVLPPQDHLVLSHQSTIRHNF